MRIWAKVKGKLFISGQDHLALVPAVLSIKFAETVLCILVITMAAWVGIPLGDNADSFAAAFWIAGAEIALLNINAGHLPIALAAPVIGYGAGLRMVTSLTAVHGVGLAVYALTYGVSGKTASVIILSLACAYFFFGRMNGEISGYQRAMQNSRNHVQTWMAILDAYRARAPLPACPACGREALVGYVFSHKGSFTHNLGAQCMSCFGWQEAYCRGHAPASLADEDGKYKYAPPIPRPVRPPGDPETPELASQPKADS